MNPAFITRGQRPDERAKTPECRTCGLEVHLHSGHRCAICGDAVEHHDVVRPNGTTARLFAECLAGRIRVAGARRAAGVELTEVDVAALATVASAVAA